MVTGGAMRRPAPEPGATDVRVASGGDGTSDGRSNQASIHFDIIPLEIYRIIMLALLLPTLVRDVS